MLGKISRIPFLVLSPVTGRSMGAKPEGRRFNPCSLATYKVLLLFIRSGWEKHDPPMYTLSIYSATHIYSISFLLLNYNSNQKNRRHKTK